MPFFKSNKNIFYDVSSDEVFDENLMDYPTLHLPETSQWDYKRELSVEDVEIWQVLYEQGGGIGVYASWKPYAEFYMVTTVKRYKDSCCPNNFIYEKIAETFYGPGSAESLKDRCKELGIDLVTTMIWVEDDEMWLYQNVKDIKKESLSKITIV